MSVLTRFLNRVIRKGALTVTLPNGETETVGTPDPEFPEVAMRIIDPKFPLSLIRNTTLAAGEGFMDGAYVLDKGSIWDLIMLAQANNPYEKGRDIERVGALGQVLEQVRHRIDNVNQRARSKDNVAHHYDLSGALYDLFLDKDKQYSCAYFADPASVSLDQAQADKKAHIAAKLRLEPGNKVLDIGCGWGGMALYLHRVADVDVLGVTLSEEQLKVARQRAADAGVSDRVKFELMDYRDVTGRFDRIVSVGMFEHVGKSQFREFFRTARNLLTEDGVMLLHTIGRLDGPKSTDGFTRKYIFPGGYAPALSEILTASEPNRLILSDVEVLRVHYYHTLKHWYERTIAKKDEIVALYDERFYRMWTFYLAGAASGFLYGTQTIYQLQYVRDRHTLPLTRDYMWEAEQALRGR